MRFFGQDIPRLSWLNGKTYSQASGGRKNRSGYALEHRAALLEDRLRATPPVESPDPENEQ